MDRKILLAISESVLARDVEDLLESMYSDIAYEKEDREERAIEKLKNKTYALVVILYIPPSGNTPMQEADTRGLQLIKWILDEQNKSPVLLLVYEMDDRVLAVLAKLQERGECDIVEINTKWTKFIMFRAKGLLEVGAQKPAEEKRLDVAIYLDPDRGYYDLSGVNVYKEHRPLKIHRTKLDSLTKQADIMVDDEHDGPWQERLQKIGEELMQQIFECNPDFKKLFWLQVGRAGGLCNARLRFSLNTEKVHNIALEAIYGSYEEGDDKDYWMLHTPIYRTISSCGSCIKPLFYGDDEEMKNKPINVLIIESPAVGKVEIGGLKELELDPIPTVRQECKYLMDYFIPNRMKGSARIGDVKRIPVSGDPKPFRQQLQDTLEESGHPWHIVHYAGHSCFIRNKGYIFLSKKKGGEIEIVDLKMFSGMLYAANTRFVYLSSCHSSDATFVFALAQKNVPSIVGFRWDIDDDKALEYTKAFYEALFEGERQSLEYAFLKARQKIHKNEEYRINPIWAAPILVSQRPL